MLHHCRRVSPVRLFALCIQLLPWSALCMYGVRCGLHCSVCCISCITPPRERMCRTQTGGVVFAPAIAVCALSSSHYSLLDGIGAEMHYGSRLRVFQMQPYGYIAELSGLREIERWKAFRVRVVDVTQVTDEANDITTDRGDDSTPVRLPRLIKLVSLAFITALA